MNHRDHQVFDAWVGLIRSHQIFIELVEKHLKRNNLPPLSWYDVLLEIDREKDKQLRLQDIGERTLLAKNNVTRLVDKLEKEGLATRIKSQSDKRGVYAHITGKGEQLLKEMWPIYRQAVNEKFAKKLTLEELETLTKIHARLTAK